MKKILIILFFFTSCTSIETVDNYDFSDNLSFDEFKVKLQVYAENNPYANIDD